MKDYTRKQVFEKYHGHCAYCGCMLPEKGWHIDHVKPVRRLYEDVSIESKGEWKRVCVGMGKPKLDCLDNCMPSCASCNINKHGYSIEEFRKNISGYLNSLNLRMVQYKMAKKYGLVVETNQPVVFYFETPNKSIL